jgi:hypothetical protein
MGREHYNSLDLRRLGLARRAARKLDKTPAIKRGTRVATVRKLSDDEVRAIERKTLGQRKATEVEYDRLLADFGPGDYGEVQLADDENRLTVRNRLKAAARRRNPPLTLDFRRTRGDTIRFSVETAAETAVVPNENGTNAALQPTPPAPEPEPAAVPKRRGRPPGSKNAPRSVDTPTTSTRSRKSTA